MVEVAIVEADLGRFAASPRRLRKTASRQRADGLVRITLKKASADKTVAVEMDQAVAAVPSGPSVR